MRNFGHCKYVVSLFINNDVLLNLIKRRKENEMFTMKRLNLSFVQFSHDGHTWVDFGCSSCIFTLETHWPTDAQQALPPHTLPAFTIGLLGLIDGLSRNNIYTAPSTDIGIIIYTLIIIFCLFLLLKMARQCMQSTFCGLRTSL